MSVVIIAGLTVFCKMKFSRSTYSSKDLRFIMVLNFYYHNFFTNIVNIMKCLNKKEEKVEEMS